MSIPPPQWAPPAPNIQPMMDSVIDDGSNEEALRRPPNAFILYSQDKRASVSQENPTLSNTEVSRILGQMWKTVPNDEKLKYKMKAQTLQEQFKQEHPNYTYRKARRKRALNELLTKTQNYSTFPYQHPNMLMMPGQMMQPQVASMPGQMISPPVASMTSQMVMNPAMTYPFYPPSVPTDQQQVPDQTQQIPPAN